MFPEGKGTRDFLELTNRAIRDNCHRTALTTAAVHFFDELKAANNVDPDLADLADDLAQAAMDYGYFNRPGDKLRLQIAVRSFDMVARILAGDQQTLA